MSKEPNLLSPEIKASFDELIIYSPAAQAIHHLLQDGNDPIQVLKSAVEYYESIKITQEKQLERYVKRHGSHLMHNDY